MKKGWILGMGLVAAAWLGSGQANAQVTASDSITVTANNQGVFTFDITQASFDFGTVDSNGTTSSTGVAGVRNGSPGTGAIYTASSAANWTCASAPSRTVKIYSDATGASHTGSLAAAALEARVPAAGGGTSAGFKAVSTTGTPAGDLITGMTVGNGGNQVSGTIDFRLTVLDTDSTGANSWTVVLTASGT